MEFREYGWNGIGVFLLMVALLMVSGDVKLVQAALLKCEQPQHLLSNLYVGDHFVVGDGSENDVGSVFLGKNQPMKIEGDGWLRVTGRHESENLWIGKGDERKTLSENHMMQVKKGDRIWIEPQNAKDSCKAYRNIEIGLVENFVKPSLGKCEKDSHVLTNHTTYLRTNFAYKTEFELPALIGHQSQIVSLITKIHHDFKVPAKIEASLYRGSILIKTGRYHHPGEYTLNVGHLPVGQNYKLVVTAVHKDSFCFPIQFSQTRIQHVEKENFVSCPIEALPESFNLPGYISNHSMNIFRPVYLTPFDREQTIEFYVEKKSIFHVFAQEHTRLELDLSLKLGHKTITFSQQGKGTQEELFHVLEPGKKYTLVISYYSYEEVHVSDTERFCDSIEMHIILTPLDQIHEGFEKSAKIPLDSKEAITKIYEEEMEVTKPSTVDVTLQHDLMHTLYILLVDKDTRNVVGISKHHKFGETVEALVLQPAKLKIELLRPTFPSIADESKALYDKTDFTLKKMVFPRDCPYYGESLTVNSIIDANFDGWVRLKGKSLALPSEKVLTKLHKYIIVVRFPEGKENGVNMFLRNGNERIQVDNQKGEWMKEVELKPNSAFEFDQEIECGHKFYLLLRQVQPMKECKTEGKLPKAEKTVDKHPIHVMTEFQARAIHHVIKLNVKRISSFRSTIRYDTFMDDFIKQELIINHGEKEKAEKKVYGQTVFNTNQIDGIILPVGLHELKIVSKITHDQSCSDVEMNYAIIPHTNKVKDLCHQTDPLSRNINSLFQEDGSLHISRTLIGSATSSVHTMEMFIKKKSKVKIVLHSGSSTEIKLAHFGATIASVNNRHVGPFYDKSKFLSLEKEVEPGSYTLSFKTEMGGMTMHTVGECLKMPFELGVFPVQEKSQGSIGKIGKSTGCQALSLPDKLKTHHLSMPTGFMKVAHYRHSIDFEVKKPSILRIEMHYDFQTDSGMRMYLKKKWKHNHQLFRYSHIIVQPNFQLIQQRLSPGTYSLEVFSTLPQTGCSRGPFLFQTDLEETDSLTCFDMLDEMPSFVDMISDSSQDKETGEIMTMGESFIGLKNSFIMWSPGKEDLVIQLFFRLHNIEEISFRLSELYKITNQKKYDSKAFDKILAEEISRGHEQYKIINGVLDYSEKVQGYDLEIYDIAKVEGSKCPASFDFAFVAAPLSKLSDWIKCPQGEIPTSSLPPRKLDSGKDIIRQRYFFPDFEQHHKSASIPIEFEIKKPQLFWASVEYNSLVSEWKMVLKKGNSIHQRGTMRPMPDSNPSELNFENELEIKALPAGKYELLLIHETDFEYEADTRICMPFALSLILKGENEATLLEVSPPGLKAWKSSDLLLDLTFSEDVANSDEELRDLIRLRDQHYNLHKPDRINHDPQMVLHCSFSGLKDGDTYSLEVKYSDIKTTDGKKFEQAVAVGSLSYHIDKCNCGGRGKCTKQGDQTICKCYTGYGGNNCELCVTGYDLDDSTGKCVSQDGIKTPELKEDTKTEQHEKTEGEKKQSSDQTSSDVKCQPASCGCIDPAVCDNKLGQCSVEQGVIKCQCNRGYLGARCDECDQSLAAFGAVYPNCFTSPKPAKCTPECKNGGKCDARTKKCKCLFHFEASTGCTTCQSGWRGPSCDEKIPTLLNQISMTHILTVSVILIVLLAIGLLAVRWILKKRKKKKRKKRSAQKLKRMDALEPEDVMQDQQNDDMDGMVEFPEQDNQLAFISDEEDFDDNNQAAEIDFDDEDEY